MVFKLVRIDAEAACEIQLPIGKHLIGRGKLLDCDDKRVSRKHGELDITVDTISIRALHQNPCFYRKQQGEQIEILKLNCSTNLYNGDKFGLLPDSHWYEVLHCSVLGEIQCPVLESTQRLEETVSCTEPNRNGLDNSTDDEKLHNVDINNASKRFDSSPLIPPNVETQPPNNDGSSILLPSDNVGSISTVFNQIGSPSKSSFDIGSTLYPQPDNIGSPSLSQNNSQSLLAEEQSLLAEEHPLLSPNNVVTNQPLNPEDPSPLKRCLSPQDSKEDIKKIKIEPQDIKQEPSVQPGPSGDQGNTSSSNSVNPGGPSSPVKLANPSGRERCIYGASCYRKNPVHKAQFAHPSDPDWGSGDRGMCPYGRSCQRRDPRHWATHEHPPGVLPPPPRPANNQRQSKKKRTHSSEESGEDSPQVGSIVSGKRTRKTVKLQSWSGSELEDEEEDPYQTDDSDEWVPGSQSQYMQDTQDD